MNFNDFVGLFFGGHKWKSRNEDNPDEGHDDNSSSFRFFMHPPGSEGFGLGHHHNGDDDDDDGGESRPFPGHGFPFSFDQEVNQMFKHFEEMFHNFGLADFPPLDIPSLDPPPTGEAEVTSPRDQMLKEPESNSNQQETLQTDQSSWFDKLRKGKSSIFNPAQYDNQKDSAKKEDTDLDDIVRQGEMDRIFGSRSPAHPDQPSQLGPNFKSFSRSISIQTIQKPDGTVETRRTETDSKGNKTTTVTSNQDGLAHPWSHRPTRPGDEEPGLLPRIDSFRRTNDEHTGDPMFSRFFGSWFKK